MKKFSSMLLSLMLVISVAVISAVSAFAQVTELPADWDPTAYEYIVVGNEGLLGEYAWQPTNEAFKMQYDEVAKIWYLNLNGIADKGERFDIFNSPLYRVVAVGYDDENPMELAFTDTGVAQHDRDYSSVYFNTDGDMKADKLAITFDGYKTYSNVDTQYEPANRAESTEHTYFATGDEPLFNPAWKPDCPEYQLTKQNSGIYSVQIPATKEMWGKDVAYRVVQDGTSDVAYNDKGLIEGENSNATVHVPEGTAVVQITFSLNSLCTQAVCYLESEMPAQRLPEAPTDKSTEASTATATAVPTESPTNATNATNATENATENATANTANATTATAVTATATTAEEAENTEISTATDENPAGFGVVVAIIAGVVILLGAGVIIVRKKAGK